LHLPIETIGSRFGGIPSGLPHVSVPVFRPSLVPGLIVPAVTVAMLGAIESLMSAMVADKMSGDRHDSNMELVAQGVANIASPLVGGLPATGAIARTATNIRSGARTPVAGIVPSLTLLVVLLGGAAAAQHDGTRRNRPAGNRGSRRRAAPFRTRADSLRRQAPAGGTARARRLPAPRRPREHLSERRRGARPRRRDAQGTRPAAGEGV